MSREIEREYREILEKPPRLLSEIDKFIVSCNGMLTKIYKLKYQYA